MVVTFYSYKGGVGRSMALANVAELLASFGYRVVVCDWDLEAPGLERYFVANHADPDESRRSMDEYLEWPGLVDLLVEYKETMSRPLDTAESRDAYGFAQLGDLWLRRPSSYARTANEHRRVPGSLRLLTAGRRGGPWQRQYGEAVRRFDWQQFYEQWAGDAYMDFFRSDLVGQKGTEGAADLLLIDSRTGVTEQGGVCTHHLADLVLVLAAANDLNMEGAKWMVQALSEPQLVKARGGRPLGVLPIASRIEQTAQTKELVEFRRLFLEAFGATLLTHTSDPEALELATEIPYMPYYSYHERVVARENEKEREHNLYAKYRAIADAIVDYGVRTQLLRERTAEGITAKAADRGRAANDAWDIDRFVGELQHSLDARDGNALAGLLDALERELHTRSEPFLEQDADEILERIQRSRQFAAAQSAAEAFIRGGVNHPRLRLVYARSLIEQGNATVALSILPALVSETAKEPAIHTPARMLIGRIFKDQYIDAPERSTAKAVRSLERAVNEYYGLYRQDPRNLRAAVSLAGLVVRARRDGIQLTDAPEAGKVGADVLREIHTSHAAGRRDWILNALAVEASLAVGDHAGAEAALIDVAHDERADAFALTGLRRQLISVWGLDLESQPGRSMLGLIDGAILGRPDGRVVIDTASLPRVMAATAETRDRLEAVFGASRLRSLEWFQRGLEHTSAVVRIDSDRGPNFGTGLLLAGDSLHESLRGTTVLVTSAHVLSPDASVADALRPGVATIVRTAAPGGETSHRVSRIVFTSPPNALDVTIAELDPEVAGASHLTVAAPDDLAKAQRVVIVGHSGGRELTFDEGDLVHRDDAIIHYRCNAGPGTSGSPVFDERWRLIAIHHAAKRGSDLPFAGAAGLEFVGEGISMSAIARELTRTLGTTQRTAGLRSPVERRPARLFVSYAHQDREFVDELKRHLSLLMRRGDITLWSDAAILPGEVWTSKLSEEIEQADIVLLLVSADYLASDFAYMEEVPRLMRRAEEGTAIVLPLIIRPVAWADAPFATFQALPKDGTPVALWSNRDAAWASVVEGIMSALERLPRPQKG